MHGEDLGIGFLILFDEETAACIVAEPARIDAHHVDGRLPINNPVCQLPAGTSGRRHAKAMAFIEPEILKAPCRSDNRRAIRRIGDGAVIHLLDAHFAKGRNAAHGCQNIGLQTLQRVGKQFIFTIGRRSIDIAGRRADFIRAKQKATGFFAHVIAGIGFAQNAHFGQSLLLALHNRRMLLGHDILMLNGDDGNVETDHCARLARKVTRTGNDVFTGDVALIGRDQPFTIGLLRDRRDRGVTINRGAALPCALCQRLCQICGLDIAIFRMLDRADHTLRVTQRPDFLDLLGRQEVHIHADGAGNACIILIFVHPVLRRRKPDVGYLRKADIQLCLCLKARVKPDRILVQFADRIAEVEQRQQTGCVPSRAGGQFLALQKNNIGPSKLSEVIQRANAHHAAANDHCTRCRFHTFKPDKSEQRIARIAMSVGGSPQPARYLNHPSLAILM